MKNFLKNYLTHSVIGLISLITLIQLVLLIAVAFITGLVIGDNQADVTVFINIVSTLATITSIPFVICTVIRCVQLFKIEVRK